MIINNPDPTRVAQITITSSFPQFSGTVVTVPAASTRRFRVLPAQIQTQYGDPVTGQFTTESKAIFASSNLPITIIASNERSTGTSGDQFYVMPNCQLGTDYMAVSDESNQPTSRMISVVILQDGTDVLFQNGSRQWAVYSGMNRGQVISYSSNAFYLSGILIHTTRAAAVISGTVCGFGVVLSGTCNHQAIMQLPISTYGQTFAMVPFAGSNFSEFTLLAAYDETTVTADGVDLGVLNANQWAQINWYNAIFTTSKPTQVIQVGRRFNATYGNPFFVHNPALPKHMIVTGLVQFATGFDTYNQATINHYVRIIVPNTNLGQVSIDSFAPDELTYIPIGVNSGYSYYEQMIVHGTHTISGQAVSFAAVVYGYDNALGYGFVAGMELPCLSQKSLQTITDAAIADLNKQ